MSASLEFYRRELERHRDYLRHVWRKGGLTFCFLGLAMAIWPGLAAAPQTPRLLLKAVPLFTLLIVWAIAFFTIKKRSSKNSNRKSTSCARLRAQIGHSARH